MRTDDGGRVLRGPAAGSRWCPRRRSVGAVPLLAAVVGVACVLMPIAPVAAQDDEIEIPVDEPAVMSELAPRSLLLDVAAVDGALVAVGERGHVVVSEDGGASWSQLPCPTRVVLTGVHFADRRLGWAVGHDAVILKTEDGGASWRIVYSDPEAEAPLLDVWFPTASEGFAIGAYGTFLETADGGESWDSRWISEDDFHLHTIDRAADGTLYIAAEAGVVYRSDDGGATWESLPSPYEGSFFGILPLDEGTVLVHGLRGHLFRSEDRGETWTAIESGTVAMLTDALDLGDGRVVVVGLGAAMLLSDDGARTFQEVPQPDRLGIQAVTQAADGGLVVAGEGGARRLRTDLPPSGGK